MTALPARGLPRARRQKLKPLELARGGPVEFGDGRAARLSELELLAGALLVAAAQRIHGDKESRRTPAVAALGGILGFRRDLEFAHREPAQQEFYDRARPFGEAFVGHVLGQHATRV